ncbi:hypothetical protein CPB85DRAFT_1299463 [Mucidula mucida]|nr:hypothetical protein CPB85DRAFT_1299463 [Mucidula mucida]
MPTNSTQPYSIIYRAGALGSSLMDSLDELVKEGRIPGLLADRIAEQFDRSYTGIVKRKVHNKTSIKGKLHQYNLCKDVWTFHVRDINFTAETRGDSKLKVTCPKVKVVASKNGGLGTAP